MKFSDLDTSQIFVDFVQPSRNRRLFGDLHICDASNSQVVESLKNHAIDKDGVPELYQV